MCDNTDFLYKTGARSKEGEIYKNLFQKAKGIYCFLGKAQSWTFKSEYDLIFAELLYTYTVENNIP